MLRPLLFVLALITVPAATAQQELSLEPAADATLYESASGSLANGSGDHLFAGLTGGGDIRRALLRFDVSDIPAGSTILSASLSLSMSRTISGNHPVAVHRVDESWGEGASDASGEEGSGTTATAGDATWVHRESPSVTWTTPGGVFSATPSAMASVGGSGRYSWSSSGLVADVQSWVDTPVANFGWILIGNEAASRSAKRFDSREIGNAGQRPTLTVTYTPGSTAVEDAEVPAVATLGQNHPNPFRGRTLIGWSLAQPETVRLEVFDLLGRRVAVLADGTLGAGPHEATFEPTGLPDGVYLYRLEAGGRVETRQMVLLR